MMERSKIYLLFSLALLVSCGSQQAAVPPQPEPTAPVQTAPVPAPEIAKEESFDPGSISQEVFDSTKVDVQHFIQDINKIVRGKDYNAWASHLGEDYFKEISSPEYLARISEQPRLKTQKIVLNSARDYFVNVVIPSRANDRVDDIEFVTQTHVKAYTVTPGGQRLRLYDRESSGNTWKIIN
jgi:hypothetical protein